MLLALSHPMSIAVASSLHPSPQHLSNSSATHLLVWKLEATRTPHTQAVGKEKDMIAACVLLLQLSRHHASAVELAVETLWCLSEANHRVNIVQAPQP